MCCASYGMVCEDTLQAHRVCPSLLPPRTQTVNGIAFSFPPFFAV